MAFTILPAIGASSIDARELASREDVSSTTVWRAARAAGDRVATWRSGRSTMLCATRAPYRVPVRRIAADGAVHDAPPLRPLATGGTLWLDWRGKATRFSGLPPEIEHCRPQGFLGRAFARRIGAACGVDANPDHWSADEVLSMLSEHGVDTPGNLIIGDAAFARFLDAAPSAPIIDASDIAPAFVARIAAAIAGDAPGSSAAGEQPKFTATIRGEDQVLQHVIAKFSPAMTQADGRRWADLLAAEQLAAQALGDLGIETAAAQCLDIGDRRILISNRFDRIGAHGRIGLVSLRAIDDEYFGKLQTPWVAATYRMSHAGMLGAADASRMRIAYVFGLLIGNSDMHYGNLSFLHDVAAPGPLRLAPIYDMLPMAFAPLGSEVRACAPLPAVAQPPGVSRREFAAAQTAAASFWKACSANPLLSAEFREFAARPLVARCAPQEAR
jgi:hypothetical protein